MDAARETRVHDFETVFDLTKSGYTTWWFPFFGFCLSLIMAMPFLSPTLAKRVTPGGGIGSRWFYVVASVFSLAWTTLAFATSLGEYLVLTAAIENGQFGVAQGMVRNFRSGPKSRESFEVGKAQFEYSPYMATNAFNGFLIGPNPFYDGRCVRLTFVEEPGPGRVSERNRLVRIEVARRPNVCR